MVMLLYQVGETLQSMAVGSSRKSVTALLELKTEEATRMINGGFEIVPPERLEVGDKLLIKTGDKIPCDVLLLSATASLDMKSLTGESALQTKTVGEECLCSCS